MQRSRGVTLEVYQVAMGKLVPVLRLVLVLDTAKDF